MKLTSFEGQTHTTTDTNSAVDFIETPQGFCLSNVLLPFQFGHAVWSCGSRCPGFFMEAGGEGGSL